ncbi:MAG: SCO family protein [Myxococcales bacterium]|nr:SCO family protein [Myxococcales bacterium]
MKSSRRTFIGQSAALVGAVCAAGACRRRATPPAMLWPIPSWSLTDHTGAPYGSAQLAGRVYVANFIFTRCPTSCPKLTRRMHALTERLRSSGDRVRFVSISVDPEWDTPPRLEAYMRRYGADAARWRFVTGPHEQVLRAIDQGFRVSSGMNAQPRGSDRDFDAYALAHSNHFALVDAQGRMRGAYSVDEESGVERLAADVEALLSS